MMMQEETARRLNLLKQQGMFGGFSEDYRQMVLTSVQKEEEVYQELTEYICSHLNLDIQVFMESQSELLMNPQNQELFQLTNILIGDLQSQIQMERESKQEVQLFHTNEPLTRERTLEIFYQQQKMEREAWMRVQRLQDSQIKEEFNVQSVYIADLILLKFGITSK
mmetsp:Transcript_3404/g.5746  ORF Transcript_3404/g.5746 Transcript_3404/m.5746 type:complete len:166 (+) Transcript_3404:475-972(+)